ncbi:efflux RND transporter periplasmic adaptor subunit [Pseudorhodoplanes sinuspersici]|uniref:Efflux transporter periplasmic adaptor subunit n=1 Tax=Pseudorhodoplanes sinuspersici TaxID=1235591 RepID=A0A1W6ZLQ7_9HYPH|nr:efflux RND transporter periplasmic adaptor subunit [Pseudorhodoplanes sinuspersici]ARP98338.1 efflux transporter periplasmic adaptor subunit [Pseudorhodoplanes sinuspersici]RKE65997.1 RND family efflux transporter MFP subunit [Pseudorhodoplanes sinuspersici]
MHRVRSQLWLAVAGLVVLTGCEEPNRYVPPPPPQVIVANPVKQNVVGYLEETGTLAAVNTVDLVARIPGFVQAIQYRDGALVKKGAPLFLIEPEPYKVKVDQAKAAEDAAKAALVQSEAEFARQADLQKRGVSAQVNYDKALAQRDTDRANVEQAEANTELAVINYGYTQVAAPFDGVVTAREVSVGEYVGANNTPTKLATIVQLDPIYVNFNVSEQDVLRIRAERAKRGESSSDILNYPVQIGLQTENGFPHDGKLDYAAPSVSAGTGTLAVRGVLANPKGVLLPGYFVRVRVPGPARESLLVPDAALGSDQGGRYVLVVNADNVVEQRKVELGQHSGAMRVILSGLNPDDRVVVDGLMRAIPGQKVDPKLQVAAAAPSK